MRGSLKGTELLASSRKSNSSLSLELMFFTTSLCDLQLQLNISHGKCVKESGRLYKAGLRNHVVMTEAT